MPWPPMDSPQRARTISVLVVLIVLGVMVTAVATDLQAHARDRHEHAELDAAQKKLQVSRFDLYATSYEKGLTTNHRDTIQASVAATLGQLATAERALSDSDADEYFQGASIGTLENCLGGVQSSFQQIATGNNTLAAEDISASSAACLSLAGGTSGGLVYPFDFPDPDVILVGGTYFAYATNSVAGNIQIIESTNLTNWNVVGNALPALPSLGRPKCDVGTGGGPDRGRLSPLLRGGRGRSGRGRGVHLGGDRRPTPGTLHRSVLCSSRVPTVVGRLHRPVSVHRHRRKRVPGVEVQRRDRTSHDLVRAARPERHRVRRQCHPVAVARPQSSVGGGSRRGSRPRHQRGALFPVLFGQQLEQRRLRGRGCHLHRVRLGPCTKPLSQPILSSSSSVQGPGGESVFTDASGSYWVAFDGWIAGAVGYPHSRDLFLRRLDLSGATPVVEAPG